MLSVTREAWVLLELQVHGYQSPTASNSILTWAVLLRGDQLPEAGGRYRREWWWRGQGEVGGVVGEVRVLGAPRRPLTTQTVSAVTTSLSPGILGHRGFLLLLVGGFHHYLTPDLKLPPQPLPFAPTIHAWPYHSCFYLGESLVISTNEETLERKEGRKEGRGRKKKKGKHGDILRL